MIGFLIESVMAFVMVVCFIDGQYTAVLAMGVFVALASFGFFFKYLPSDVSAVREYHAKNKQGLMCPVGFQTIFGGIQAFVGFHYSPILGGVMLFTLFMATYRMRELDTLIGKALEDKE